MTTPTTWPGLGFDPAPGDPAGVNGLVTQLSTTARYLQQTHDTLTELTRQQGAWTGEASKSFTETLDVLPRYLIDAHESLRKAGDVLGGWNGTLGGLQGRARELEGQAVTTRADLVSAAEAERQARAHPDFGLIGQTFSAQDLPVAQSRIDAAQAGLDRAVTSAAALRTSLEDLLRKAGELGTEHADAARGAANGVRGADDGLAPPEPGWFDQAVGWVKDNLGTIGDVAGFISGIASAAALIPILTPFAAPIALISGGVALLAHGADIAVNDKWADPGAWIALGGDVVGMFPGGRIVLGAAGDLAWASLQTTPGIGNALRAGWDAGVAALPRAVDDVAEVGGIATRVGDRLAPLTAHLPGFAAAADPASVAKGFQATMDIAPQVPTVNEWFSGEDQTVAKDVAGVAGAAAGVGDIWLDHVDRLAAAAT